MESLNTKDLISDLVTTYYALTLHSQNLEHLLEKVLRNLNQKQSPNTEFDILLYSTVNESVIFEKLIYSKNHNIQISQEYLITVF